MGDGVGDLALKSITKIIKLILRECYFCSYW